MTRVSRSMSQPKTNMELVRLGLPSGVTLMEHSTKWERGLTWAGYEKWANFVSGMKNLSEDSVPYWVGDLILAGEELFPEKYAQALEFTNYGRGSLANMVYLCRNVPPENRGILPPSVTIMVAKYEVGEQKKLLERGREEGLTQREFRLMLDGVTDYKRKALPDDISGTRGKREEKMAEVLAKWDRIWSIEGRVWMNMTAERMGEEIWKKATLECLGS